MGITIILVIISIIWIMIASIVDLKKREVPDWISYSLIIIGVVLNLINAILENNFSLLINPLVGFATFFLIANLMYYSKQWGGGDAKLMIGIGIIFSTYPKPLLKFFTPNLDLPFLVILLINILIFGALYGISWTILLVFKNKEKLIEEFKGVIKNNRKTRLIVTISTLLLILLSSLLDPNLRWLVIILAFMLFSLTYLSFLIRSVENCCMLRKISVDKLTEGDWIVNKIIVNTKTIYTPKNTGITKEDISNLKKFRGTIKYLTIKEGIPFVPSFLLSTVVSLIFGNIIMLS